MKHISGTISGKNNKPSLITKPLRADQRQSSKVSNSDAVSQNNTTEEDKNKDKSADTTPLLNNHKDAFNSDHIPPQSQQKSETGVERETIPSSEPKKDAIKEETAKTREEPLLEESPVKVQVPYAVSTVKPVDLYEDEVEQYCNLYLQDSTLR